MTINSAGGLVGLSLLTGTNSFSIFAENAVTVESRAVRQAKALFTLPDTTPPWKEDPTTQTVSAQVSAIKALKTIIDKPATGSDALPEDVQSAFTTYKALDRLRLLAETAAKSTTSSTERGLLQASFGKGLDDLESFLSTAASDKLHLFFDTSTRRAESVGIRPAATLNETKVMAQGVVKNRADPLPGLTGTEQFSIKLSSGGRSDTVTVDLTGTPQPPTLDSVSAAINAAIATVPMRNSDGTVHLDENGDSSPRWNVKFVPQKSDGKWGLSINRSGYEKIEIDQVGAKDALMVATGVTALDAPTATRVMRVDDPASSLEAKTLNTIKAEDPLATERADLVKAAGSKVETAQVWASTKANAIATDANGFSYVVGTTAGDLDGNLGNGSEDLFLTKVDSEGRTVWQRSLGAAGSASGAAVTIAPNGDVVVAGTVNGTFGTVGTDGDMVVARYDAKGDEKFTSVVRSAGSDSASAIAVAADGSIYVGGKSAANGGDSFVARLDATGHLQQRQSFDSGGTDRVAALAFDGNGKLLALTREGQQSTLRKLDPANLSNSLGTLSLGTAEARALAVAADGSIAVVGATSGNLTGTQVNARSGGRDGFVARIDAGLSGASVTYLGTSADDQADSVAFMNGQLYVGGRTTGAMDGARQGAVDGFVTRIDPATGAVSGTDQFGQPTLRSEPVQIAAAAGGASALGALGLNRGTITPEDSIKLVAQTGLRAGDEFSLKIGDGSVRKITITADDTLATLADRVRLLTGSKATISTAKKGDEQVLRIDAKPGSTIQLIAGADGRDALAKLGIAPQQISAAATRGTNDPTVQPGGNYGLDLTKALNLSTAKDAAVALARINSALSMSQSAYRSLYWDDTKAALADGGASSSKTGASTAVEQGQLANYQAALTRLSASSTTTSTTTTFFGI